MREIKFRGFRKDIGWKYGYYYVSNHGGALRIETVHYIRPIDEEYISYGVAPETIGQYTGLKDKNGKEIYEGDILRLDEFYNLWLVEWHEAGFYIRNAPYSFDYYALEKQLAITREAIGNIYEIPELLEAK